LESQGTSENSELDFRGQISLHLSVPSVIGKVLKCRCPKWPRIGHLDICSPSYGQKKGRESNCQFDSRPLKVGNRPVPDVRSGSETWRWKALFKGYKFGSDLVPIGGRGEELRSPKIPESKPKQFRDSTLGVPGKRAIRMPLLWANADYTIGSMVVASPEFGPWCVSCESELARGLSQHQMHAEWALTNSCWFWMQVRDQIAWSFPSLIPKLPTRPLYPS
jgi:hypothetical protein